MAARHASRRPNSGDSRPGSDFWDRIERGHNTTKMGGSTSSRDVAAQIAAQARAAVDPPTLQCIGPQSINQGLKAVCIARTYLQQSDESGESSHPDLVIYPEFIKISDGGEEELSGVNLRLSKRARRTTTDVKDGRTLKVGNSTDAKSLAGAIANCTREGSRVDLTAIGAGSVNQAIKAIAIARQCVERESLPALVRPPSPKQRAGVWQVRGGGGDRPLLPPRVHGGRSRERRGHLNHIRPPPPPPRRADVNWARGRATGRTNAAGRAVAPRGGGSAARTPPPSLPPTLPRFHSSLLPPSPDVLPPSASESDALPPLSGGRRGEACRPLLRSQH